MWKWCLLIILLVYPEVIKARPEVDPDKKKVSAGIKLAYNSSLIYPGIRTGIEFPFTFIHLEKNKKNNRQVNREIERCFTLNAGWYHHPGFHDNIYPTIGYLIRRKRENGFLAEFSPEAGLSRTYLGGTTYQVDDNGNVSILKNAGYAYFLLSVSGGIGYSLSARHGKPLIIYVKGSVLGMLPYNSTVYIRPALEAGVVFKPKAFLKRQCKIRTISR